MMKEGNRMVGILVIVGCLMAVEEPSAKVEPPNQRTAEVRRLLRQLDAARLEDRNAAEAALAGLGPDVLPLLPASDGDLSAEVRQRLSRVRQQLEQKLAAAAVEPSRVTLRKDPIRLSQLLEQIQLQTGNRIVDARGQFGGEPDDPELTVNFDKTPFWKVMEVVLEKANVAMYPFEAQQAITLVERRTGAVAWGRNASPAGPFLFVPADFTARRMLDDAGEGTLRLGVLVAWEPRLSPVGLTQKLSEVEATDEKGDPVEVDVRLGELEVPVGAKATSVKLIIPFTLPPRDVRKIARLVGTLDALVPGPVETFRFEGLPDAKEVKKRVASATVTLQAVRKNNETWEVEVRVRFDEADDALASHRGWIFANEAYLEGPDGKRIDHDGYETRMQTENEVGLAYFFYLEGSPEKHAFVYKTPARIFKSRFKYEFKDLDLP